MRGQTDRELNRLRRILRNAEQKPNGNGHVAPGERPEILVGPGELWRNVVQKSPSTGAPIANLYNALLALRNDPVWVGKLRYNDMQRTAITEHGPLTDIEIFRIHEWLQANGFPRMALEPVREAVALVAREHAFHPIRDWLAQLEWDETERIWSWLHRIVGTPDDEYHTQVGALFLTAMVARVFEPGCQSDYTLVLEGPQKQLKSSLCRLIAGPCHFSASLPPLDGDPVRLSMHLRGKWIVEIAELSAFQRADNEKLKAFLTNPVEQYTPKFAREEVFEPRQCLFIGTTNKFAWMKDETGGRRFWPVRCANINLDAFEAERSQLFAEATQHYKTYRQWWPENTVETTLFEPQQADRYEADAWVKPIVDWDFAVPRGRDNLGNTVRQKLSGPYYLVDIAEGAIGILPERLDVRNQRRLVAALEFLGWERSRRTKHGIPWIPPAV